MNKEYWNDHLLTYFSLLLLMGGGGLSAKFPGFAAIYPMLIGGILTLVAAHKGNETVYDFLQKPKAAPEVVDPIETAK